MRKVVFFLLVMLLVGCENDTGTKQTFKEVENLNCHINLPLSFKIKYEHNDIKNTIYYLKNDNKLIIIDNNKFDDNMEYYEKIVKNNRTGWVHLIEESDYELGYVLDEKIYDDTEIEEILYNKLGYIVSGCDMLQNSIYQYEDELINEKAYSHYKSNDVDLLLDKESLLTFRYNDLENNLNILEYADNITTITELTLPNVYLFNVEL